MKTFLQWMEENELNIEPVVQDASEGEPVDTGKSKGTINEKRARTGYSANYPPAYVSAQYPHKWFSPRKATADLDASFMPGQPKGS